MFLSREKKRCFSLWPVLLSDPRHQLPVCFIDFEKSYKCRVQILPVLCNCLAGIASYMNALFYEWDTEIKMWMRRCACVIVCW